MNKIIHELYNIISSFGIKISNFFTQEKRIILYEILIFYSLILVLFKWNPMNISTNYPIVSYIFLTSVFFVLIMFFLYFKGIFNVGSSAPNFSVILKKFFGLVVTILTIITIIFTIIYIIKNFPYVGSLIAFLISSMIIIGFIILILYLIKNFLKNSIFLEKILDFIKNFYIKYFKSFLNIDYIEQYGNLIDDKFKPIWYIIIFEFVLISLYFLLPFLFNLIMSHDGIKLLENPVYLNQQKTLSEKSLHTKFSKKNIYNYRYSISAWFNLNSLPPNSNKNNNKYTNIINYGNKPKVSFNILTNSLSVQTEIKNKELKEILLLKKIPYQKWNNIVINYDGGIMDIFLNGNLVASESNVSPLMSYENIIIGEKDGLEGGIKNVTFFNRILSKGEIKYGYKIYKK